MVGRAFIGIARIILCGIVFGGCSAANIGPPKRIEQAPENQLRNVDLEIRALPAVGNVLPVQVAVTNLTTLGMFLDATAIQADSVSGTSVTVLRIDDAIQAAGGSDALANGLPRQNLVHVDIHQGQVGDTSAAGVAKICVDSIKGGGGGYGPGAGAVPLLVCGLAPVVAVVYRGAVAASPSLQVKDLALQADQLVPGVEDWGYIFLPAGHYRAIEAPVGLSTGERQIIVQAWDSAADLAAETKSPPADAAAPATAASSNTPAGGAAPNASDRPPESSAD